MSNALTWYANNYSTADNKGEIILVDYKQNI